MLGKDELESYKTFNDPYQVEKDYLQELLLYEVYSKRYTTDHLIFKGGTSLSKFYNSNRFSEDLDFTIAGENQGGISKGMEKVIGSLFYKSVFAENFTINKFGTMSADVSIEGPRYNKKTSTLQHIRLEINTTSKPEYSPIPIIRNPPYRDLADYTALVMDKREILAEKIRAIVSKGRRHKERDLYDMRFLFSRGAEVSKDIVLKKLEQSQIVFSRKLILDSIASVEKTWQQLEPFVVQKLPAYKETRAYVLDSLVQNGIL